MTTTRNDDTANVSELAPSDIEDFASDFDAVVSNIERVVQGKRPVVHLVTAGLVAEGHVLIEDVPGVGKTLLAKALARSIQCEFNRIQFTPDLLPSDVTGVSLWDRKSGQFHFNPGAIFANVVVGDEINRASPKTQSALLEAMEERQVTTDGTTRELPLPFMVLATQNPLEHEGTYPLPEAQLDRFMMRLSIGYPERETELGILDTHGVRSSFLDLKPVITADRIREMIESARRVHVSSKVKAYIVDLVEATRAHPALLLGASPRSSLYLLRLARVWAGSRGRDYVTPDDVKHLSPAVLTHRLALRPDAYMRGSTADAILKTVIDRVPVPGASGRVAT